MHPCMIAHVHRTGCPGPCIHAAHLGLHSPDRRLHLSDAPPEDAAAEKETAPGPSFRESADGAAKDHPSEAAAAPAAAPEQDVKPELVEAAAGAAAAAEVDGGLSHGAGPVPKQEPAPTPAKPDAAKPSAAPANGECCHIIYACPALYRLHMQAIFQQAAG